jgi:uncharacterized protein YdaU (DUF1376 family)
MNYYLFHIGDYAAHTKGLTPMEDLAYRRLLDLYYLQECPLTGTPEQITKKIGLSGCSTDVEQVLNDYFEKTEFGWSNKRADDEIERFQAKSAQASRAANASVEARKAKQIKDPERTLNDRSAKSGRSTNQEPRTKNQEPNISSVSKDTSDGRKRAKQIPADFQPNDKHKELAQSLGVDLAKELEQFTDHHRAKGSTMLDWNAALRTWIRNAAKYAKPGKAAGKPAMLWNKLNEQDFKKGISDDDRF